MNMIRSAGMRLGVVLFAVCLSLSASRAGAANTWQDVRSTMALFGMATNGALYVGAGGNGIWTSTDLKTWQHVSLPASAGVVYNDVLWDGSRFVAVGNGLITSTDGSNWTVAVAPTSAEVWNAITLSSGTYVVVGSDASKVLRSTDGKLWALTATGLSVSSFSYLNPGNGSGLGFSGIGTNGTTLVASGYQFAILSNGAISPNADIVATSTDGISWSASTLPSSGGDQFSQGLANDVAWGFSTYVVGGIGGVYTSLDAATWTAHTFPSTGSGEWIFSRVQFVKGQFIATGTDTGTAKYAVFSSPDGVNWTEHAVTAQQRSFFGLSSISTAGSSYVAAGESGVYTSTALTAWTQTASTPETNFSACLLYAGGKFVIPGDPGSLSSSDGMTWPATTGGSVVSADNGGQGCAAYGNGTFVAVVGLGSGFEWSTDALSWTFAAPSATVVALYEGVAWTGSEFVAVGQSTTGSAGAQPPKVVSSSDGKTWSDVSTTGLPATVTQFGTVGLSNGSLAYLNGQLVAWGISSANAPFIAVSPDGAAWSTSAVFSADDSVGSVAYGNGQYVVIGNDVSGNTLVATSTDASHWTQVSSVASGTHAHWVSLIWGDSEFVASGGDIDTAQGLILNSSDGKSWTLTGLPSAKQVESIAWSGTSYVAAAFYDIFEYTPPATSGGGGGTGGGGTPSSGGGGAFDILALSLLSGLAIRRRERWMRG